MQVLSVQTPIAVQAMLPKLLGEAKLIYLGECNEDNTTVYAVTALRGLQREEFVMDAEGKVLTRVVALAALPEPAQKYLRAQAGNARIAHIEKLADGNLMPDRPLPRAALLARQHGPFFVSQFHQPAISTWEDYGGRVRQ